MQITDSLKAVFDKNKALFTENKSMWVIKESDTQATFKKLTLKAEDGIFCIIDNDFYKGWKTITENKSSYLHDSDCDGVAFLTKDNHASLWFVDLKSNFDTKKIGPAFKQTLYSFIKINMLLPLCEGYDIEKLDLHFLVGCKTFKNIDQETWVLDNIMMEIEKGSSSFNSICLYPLLKGKTIITTLNETKLLGDAQFNNQIKNLKIYLHLFLSEQYEDSEGEMNIDQLHNNI